MSKEKRRVPKLRFPGFTEDWEQRKLSDILVERNEQQVETNEYPLMSFVQGHGVIPKGERYDRSFLVLDQSKKYKRTELGDFIYSSNNLETGSIGINKTGKAVISPVYSIFYGVSIGDSQFIGIMSLLPRFITKMIRFRQGVVYGQWRIHEKDFLDISILIPSEAERTKITKLILSIEELITLHQRKLDNLKLKKKALLQKLFPKNGERYPELRFPGFTDAWEQRKADYIFKSVTEKGYPELPVLSASQELGMVYRDQNGIDIQHDKKNESSYKRVSPGQFVIHLRSFQGGFAYSEVEGITSPAYTVMSFKNSSEQYGLFWKYVFKSETFIKRLETITYGIRDGRSISFSDFKSLMLQYPSFSEQELIGDLIAVIERGITLHQRKLDHLQLQKKALLQQMFV
ncbi:hypothetical protein [Veillonella parvula]|uniref:hypothetical protein n=1 Tax=Veillonella parvula TaxID=29466 RepID=UPI001C8B105F|nr:hypothetical protein [Veillonella parvula]